MVSKFLYILDIESYTLGCKPHVISFIPRIRKPKLNCKRPKFQNPIPSAKPVNQLTEGVEVAARVAALLRV